MKKIWDEENFIDRRAEYYGKRDCSPTDENYQMVEELIDYYNKETGSNIEYWQVYKLATDSEASALRKKIADYSFALADKDDAEANYASYLICKENNAFCDYHDEEKACEYLINAGELDSINAQIELYFQYTDLEEYIWISHDGVSCVGEKKRYEDVDPQNEERALYWLRRAAGNNSGYAQYLLANRYLSEKMGMFDKKEGIRWLGYSAENDDANALYQLAYKYENGVDVDKNTEKAFDYYFRADELGRVEATIDVGRCYLLGIGTEVDYEQAYKVFRACSYDELCSEAGEFFLGYMALHGYSMEQDIRYGLNTICDAANHYFGFARRFIDDIMNIMPD